MNATDAKQPVADLAFGDVVFDVTVSGGIRWLRGPQIAGAYVKAPTDCPPLCSKGSPSRGRLNQRLPQIGVAFDKVSANRGRPKDKAPSI